MRLRVFYNASAALLIATVGVSPAVAYPPVEQRSAVSEGSQVLDPTDYGPRSYSSSGSGSNIYGGGASSNTYSSTPKTAAKPVAGNNQWEMVNQLQQLQEEVQQLRGMIEQQTFEIEQMRKQQRERYLDLDTRIGRLQGGAVSTGSVSSGTTESEAGVAQSAASSQAPAAATSDEKQAYSAALENVKAKQFTAAISQLETLLVASPNGQLAPNCHYWLGELYMVNDPADYDKAKAHFQQLLKNHSDHAKVPDALYKLGKLSALKGDRDRAKVYFDRVIKEFPDAQASVLAKDYLKRL